MSNDINSNDESASVSQSPTDAEMESDQLLIDAAGAIEGSTLDDPDHLVEGLADGE